MGDVVSDRYRAATCLRAAHGHIATAYSQIQGEWDSPAHRARCLRETLDAVDWIRRALEHMAGLRGSYAWDLDREGTIMNDHARAWIGALRWLFEDGVGVVS